jgi:hypothetical protein
MKRQQRDPNVVASIRNIFRALICGLMIASTAAAQTVAVAPISSPAPVQEIALNTAPHAVAPAQSSVMPKDAGGTVKFNVPNVPVKVGYAFNLCTGQEIPLPRGPYSDTVGQTLDTNQGQCGDLNGPRPGSTVVGGNPPYHFQLDTMGGFPPIGMHLGMNGVLYGTPSARPPLGGYGSFRVCAVDLNGSSDCPEVNVQPVAHPPAPSHAGELLLLGGIVILGVAAAAYTVSNKSTSSTSSTSGGQCSGISGNACAACTSDSQCGADGVCFLYSSDGGQTAPFCN